MKKLPIILSLFPVLAFAQVAIKPITQINDINKVGQEYYAKPVSWFQGESIRFDVLARDARNPIDFSGQVFPVLFVGAETNRQQVYITKTGTVVSATNGHVRVEVPAESAALSTSINYSAWMLVFRVDAGTTAEVANVAYSSTRILPSPLGVIYTNIPAQTTFVINAGGIVNEADPIFTSSVARAITSGMTSQWSTAYSWGNWATSAIPEKWSSKPATQSVNMAHQYLTNMGGIDFDVSPSGAVQPARLQWEPARETLKLGLDPNVNLDMGQQLLMFGKSIETNTINKGEVVFVAGAAGDNPTVKRASNASESLSARTIGIAAENITSNNNGFIVTRGTVYNLNTTNFTQGAMLYLGANGTVQTNLPDAPLHGVFIGTVERVGQNNGQIYVAVQNYQELEELSDVKLTSVSDGDLIAYNSASNRWENYSLPELGIATGVPVYVESDTIATNRLTNYYTITAADAKFATGTPLYVESAFNANSNRITLLEGYTNRAASALSSSVWANADSTTNYLPSTGGYMSGTLFGQNVIASNHLYAQSAIIGRPGNSITQTQFYVKDAGTYAFSVPAISITNIYAKNNTAISHYGRGSANPTFTVWTQNGAGFTNNWTRTQGSDTNQLFYSGQLLYLIAQDDTIVQIGPGYDGNGDPIEWFNYPRINYDGSANLDAGIIQLFSKSLFPTRVGAIAVDELWIQDPNNATYIKLTASNGLQVGQNSFRALLSGDIEQDSTNTATLGIVSATSFSGNAVNLTNFPALLATTSSLALVEAYTNRAASALASSVWASADSTTNYALRTTFVAATNALNNKFTNYLPLAGGTMSGPITMGGTAEIIGVDVIKRGTNIVVSFEELFFRGYQGTPWSFEQQPTIPGYLTTSTWASADSTTNYASRITFNSTSNGFNARISAVEDYTNRAASALSSSVWASADSTTNAASKLSFESFSNQYAVADSTTNHTPFIVFNATSNDFNGRITGVESYTGRVASIEGYTNRAASALSSSVWASADSTTNYTGLVLFNATSNSLDARISASLASSVWAFASSTTNAAPLNEYAAFTTAYAVASSTTNAAPLDAYVAFTSAYEVADSTTNYASRVDFVSFTNSQNVGAWSYYSATQSVDMAAQDITNVAAISSGTNVISLSSATFSGLWQFNSQPTIPGYLTTNGSASGLSAFPASLLSVSAGNSNYWRITTAPASNGSFGQRGQIAVASNYVYVYNPDALGAGTGRWIQINGSITW